MKVHRRAASFVGTSMAFRCQSRGGLRTTCTLAEVEAASPKEDGLWIIKVKHHKNERRGALQVVGPAALMELIKEVCSLRDKVEATKGAPSHRTDRLLVNSQARL